MYSGGGGAVCVRVCARVHTCVCVSFILFPVVTLATGYEPVSTAVKYSVYVLGVYVWEGSKEPGGGGRKTVSATERGQCSIPRAGALSPMSPSPSR